MKIGVHRDGRLLDFGVHVPGSLEAGKILAGICMADFGSVQIHPESSEPLLPGPEVEVVVSEPTLACMGCQYGGWPVKTEGFFAIGSGPMRLKRGREPVLKEYGFSSSADQVVGVLECNHLPDDKVINWMAGECGVATEGLFLCVAPTGSLAGSLQIVARSVEATMHKLYELGFDLNRIRQGRGRAPLPPATEDNLAALGRTNDSIMYGGRVLLWLDATDAEISELGPQVPSNSSPEFGRSFSELFGAAGGDFYQMDPLLFSAAQVTLIGDELDAGHTFGELRPAIVRQSFADR